MTAEQWRPVVGHEGAYEVSDAGRVRSVDREWQQVSRWGGLQRGFIRGRVLCRGHTLGGYVQVNLNSAGKGRSKTVHSIVLEAFVGPRPPNAEALHLNHDKADCSLANLKWGTRRENEDAKVAAGRTLRGEKSPVAKLTVAAIHAIRARRGEPQQDLADEFGCTFGNISAIQRRKSWRHV